MVRVVYRQMPGAARGGVEAEAPPGRRGARVEVAFEQLGGVVLDLLHRRSARGAGLDELEPGVKDAPSAGLAAGDDGFVAPQLGDGAEDGTPVAVEERDDAPHGEPLPGEAGVGRLFGHRGRESRSQTAGDAVRLAAGLLAPAANERSVNGGWGGPVLDVEVVHLGLVVEVVVRHPRVVGRRRDHDEPE